MVFSFNCAYLGVCCEFSHASKGKVARNFELYPLFLTITCYFAGKIANGADGADPGARATAGDADDAPLQSSAESRWPPEGRLPRTE